MSPSQRRPQLKCEEHRAQSEARPGSSPLWDPPSPHTHTHPPDPDKDMVYHPPPWVLPQITHLRECSRPHMQRQEHPTCTLSTKVSVGLPSAQPRQLGSLRVEGLERRERSFKGNRAGWWHLGDHSSIWWWVDLAVKQLMRATFSSLPATLWDT